MSSLFVSYSRQDSPFANSLLGALEHNGFNVWVDYENLTPAKPWAEQICQGIEEADVVLLVVSKESMSSQYAGEEIEIAFDLKKRVLLIILEAVELPQWLQQLEWVDFRRSFKKGMNELLTRLQSPSENRPLPPEKGFAAPPTVWISFLVSLAVASISLLTFWTLYIPYYLLPLPYRILKRDFRFFHVQLALIILPLAVLISLTLVDSEKKSDSIGALVWYWFASFLFSLTLVPLLIFLLRSRAMRRWGKPIASRPEFANPDHPKVEKPRPVTFMLDAAPEDGRYGDDLIKELEKYGHRCVVDEPEAEVAFVLLSRYKTTTTLNPETRIVYPVLLQSTRGIDSKVERIQWIDFRRGLRNLDSLAQLLPEPARIIKALGIAPLGNQTVLPPIIQALVIYLILVGIFTFGGWSVSVLQLKAAVEWKEMWLPAFCVIILLGSVFWITRSLINRKGRMASLHYLIPVLLFGIGSSVVYLTIHILNLDESLHLADKNPRGMFIIFCLFFYFLGLIILMPLALWYWKDLRRWCPRKNKLTKQAASQP